MLTHSSYEWADAVSAVASNAPLVQIYPNQVGPLAADKTFKRIGLTFLAIQLKTAVASQFGLTAPTTAGTATAPVNGNLVSRYNGGAGTAIGFFAKAWSAAPAVASGLYSREAYLPASIGAAVEWSWPEDDPYTLNLDWDAVPDFGVAIRNLSGGACADVLVTARWVETLLARS